MSVSEISELLEREYKDKFSLIFKSITVDNGVEFLDMAGLEKSVYNKLSKWITISYIKKIQDCMNNYPGKLFNYKSANDIFCENLNNCLNCCKRF